MFRELAAPGCTMVEIMHPPSRLKTKKLSKYAFLEWQDCLCMYLLGNAGNCSNYYYEMAISKANASTMMSLAMCGTAPIQFNHTQTHIPAGLLARNVKSAAD